MGKLLDNKFHSLIRWKKVLKQFSHPLRKNHKPRLPIMILQILTTPGNKTEKKYLRLPLRETLVKDLDPAKSADLDPRKRGRRKRKINTNPEDVVWVLLLLKVAAAPNLAIVSVLKIERRTLRGAGLENEGSLRISQTMCHWKYRCLLSPAKSPCQKYPDREEEGSGHDPL